MEQGKEYHINNSTIKIIFGDILDSQAEVIVSSGGSMISMRGGISRTIRKAGGDVIREKSLSMPSNIRRCCCLCRQRIRTSHEMLSARYLSLWGMGKG